MVGYQFPPALSSIFFAAANAKQHESSTVCPAQSSWVSMATQARPVVFFYS